MRRKNWLKRTGYLFIVLGLSIVGCSLSITIRQQAMKRNAIEAFRVMALEKTISEASMSSATLKQEDAEAVSAKEAVAGDILYMLRIPRIDSENPVREGVSQGVLVDSLGHEPETAHIGEGGNCVIAGHRNYSFGSFFNRLNEVEIGDLIYVDTATDSFSYRVTDIRVVEPEDLSVLARTDTETLTLYTCTPLYLATHRLVVIAQKNE